MRNKRQTLIDRSLRLFINFNDKLYTKIPVILIFQVIYWRIWYLVGRQESPTMIQSRLVDGIIRNQNALQTLSVVGVLLMMYVNITIHSFDY